MGFFLRSVALEVLTLLFSCERAKICYNILNILLILHGENMAVKKKKIVISKLNRNNNHKHSEKRKRNK